jgi:aldose sugar dehydrogenase
MRPGKDLEPRSDAIRTEKALVLRAALIGTCAVLALAAPATAGNEISVYQTLMERIRVVPIADGFDRPWSVAFLPDGSMLVTERPGRLRLIKDGQLQKEPIRGVPGVYAQGEGGLLDVAIHPRFEINRFIYLSYTVSRPSPDVAGGIVATTVVARARLFAGNLDDVKVIFTAEPWTASQTNFGSRLLFAPEDMLFVTLGDHGDSKDEAQNLGNDLGKIVRIRDDGSIPPDNPFIKRAGARPEIYSYGHRNVQGIAQRSTMRQIWAHEHGPKGGDELNLVKPGGNYGWPRITFADAEHGQKNGDKTMEPPVTRWDKAIGPSGMTFYFGEKFLKWRGNLFVGSLDQKRLKRIPMERDIAASQEDLLVELGERIRDVRSGPDGFLYVVTGGENGRLLRIEPALIPEHASQ